MPDFVPAESGAYVLIVRLESALPLDIKKFPETVLAPGRYAYCGSAYGPGGLRARVGRHLGPDKKIRWHIDRLTAVGKIDRVHIRIGGQECDLVDVLLARGATVPIKGFGNSDCRRCQAHLLAIPENFAWPSQGTTIGFGRGGARPL